MANAGAEGAALVPARMVNEFSYCPRLFYLEWVDGEFDDNHFTAEGQVVHRRVDEGEPVKALGTPRTSSVGVGAGVGASAAAEEASSAPWQVRSIEVSSQVLGVSGKIDLVEGGGDGGGGEVMPVDRKRGKAPDVPEGAWEPERVQLCLYGLLLREAGYPCQRGELYFVGSRKRVEIAFDEALIARTLELTQAARRAAQSPTAPAPLVGSPKCDGCSLAGLCLPDELNVLRGVTTEAPRPDLFAGDLQASGPGRVARRGKASDAGARGANHDDRAGVEGGETQRRHEGRHQRRTEAGVKRGRIEGQRDALLRILSRRFGRIPKAARARVMAAELPELDAWLDRALDAQRIDAVFRATH